MNKKNKNWKGIEERDFAPEFRKSLKSEFPEDGTPDLFQEDSTVLKSDLSRRSFLKASGFSVASVLLASCIERKVEKAIPYLIKPEEITPGKANYYASTYFDGSDYCSILVKTREGRPIKIEGNELSAITGGGTNARVQASVLSLYDSERLQHPLNKGSKSSWEEIDSEIIQKLNEISNDKGNIKILNS